MLPEHNFEEFEKNLDRMELPTLSARERDAVWDDVRGRIAPRVPVASPYIFGFISLNRTTMIPIAIALAVLLGASGTVVASNDARPGDLLFPIDRITEEARIAVAFKADAKAELRARFAEERLKEFEEIVAEETHGKSAEAHGTTTVGTTGSTTATTTISARGEARVEHALSVLNSFLEDAHVRASSTAHARAVLSDLDARFDTAVQGLPADMRARFQVHTDTDDDLATTTEERIEAEAEVFNNHTNVKVRIDDHPTNFTTSANTRADIVTEISDRLDLDSADVDAALKLNVQNHDSEEGGDDSDHGDTSTNMKVRVHGADNAASVKINGQLDI